MPVPTFQRMAPYTGADDFQQLMAREGFSAVRRRMTREYESRVDEAARLFGDVLSGKEDPIILQEAMNPRRDYVVEHINRKYPGLRFMETMSVTDFSQYLTVDVLDRILYGRWSVTSIPNKPLVKMETLRDFRTVKRFEIDGAVKPFTKSMNPAEPPKQRTLTPVAPITYAPDLYQGYESVNWRAIVNDDLGIFNDLVQRLSDSWNLTLWQAITQIYVDASGPNVNLYNSTFKNLLLTANGASTDNPPLDFQGLIDARTVLGKMLSPDGYPILFTGTLYLWFGPSLKTTADALLAALRADISVGGGTENASGFPTQRLSVGPAYITGGLVPIEDKYIPLVCTAGTVANTMWGLTYDPSAQPRPSGVMGVLQGFETPQLFQRAPNTMRAGGGIDPMMGSFDTMDTDYKSIAVFGTTQVDGRSTVASFGQ